MQIPLGTKKANKEYVYPLPLDKLIKNRDAINSYFEPEQLYEIKNENNQVVDSFKGIELHSYFSEMLKSEQEKAKQRSWWENEQERKRLNAFQAQERKELQYYFNNKFKNSTTNKTYKISVYAKDGRLKNNLELIFTLAYIVIHGEYDRWEPKETPKEDARTAYFGPPAWRAQNMMDALQIAREEGLTNQSDIENRLNTTGAALSRARAAVKRNEKVKGSMETLKQAIDEYESLKYVVEDILNLSDGDEKYIKLHDNKDKIEKYTNAKRIMHLHKVNSPADIFDFKKRYVQVLKNIEESQQLLDLKKDEYRRIKKLQYNTSLAQDVRYCYGLEYKLDNEIEKNNNVSKGF